MTVEYLFSGYCADFFRGTEPLVNVVQKFNANHNCQTFMYFLLQMDLDVICLHHPFFAFWDILLVNVLILRNLTIRWIDLFFLVR